MFLLRNFTINRTLKNRNLFPDFGFVYLKYELSQLFFLLA
ncbi:hypothetical protein FORC47_p451 (plasmid) [Bacillus cereus]|nr:hypothetical protein FORC47_p451 [Bacillus cereus]